MEHPDVEQALDEVSALAREYLDMAAIRTLSESAPLLESGSAEPSGTDTVPLTAEISGKARVGVLKDKAFSFYYPENLEALEALGATLIFISPISDNVLPDVDALYGKRQIRAWALELHFVGLLHQFFQRVHGARHLRIVEGADLVVEVGE